MEILSEWFYYLHSYPVDPNALSTHESFLSFTIKIWISLSKRNESFVRFPPYKILEQL